MYYIGIDVHRKKCVTTIKGDTKQVLKRTSFDNDITGINGFVGMLRSYGYLPATAACESTGNYWIVLHDTLEAAGIDTLLAHPYHLKIITQTAYKNDKADSEELAELCRHDMIPESFVVNAGLVRNSPNRLDQSDTFNDPRSPARGNERTQQTGRILAVL